MQANNLFYYPYAPFFNLHACSPMFPCFQPLFPYSAPSEKSQYAQLQPVQNISAAFSNSHNLQTEAKSAEKAQIKAKKHKITPQIPKLVKEKASKSSNKNTKSSKALVIEQKEGRNANSNILRMFFRRLQNKIQDSPQLIQQVIQKYQMEITLQEFIQWIQINRIDHRNYIRVPTIRKFFIEQQFVREHTKIMRILFKDFVDSEAVSCYLTSKKVRRNGMNHNYNAIRSIFSDILAFKP